MNTKVKYHSVAVRCSDLPVVHWAESADDIFHRWEGGHVWLIDSNDFSLDQIRGYAQKLSYDELDKASRFHFEKDRRQYVLTHGILRELLGKYFLSSQKVSNSQKVTLESPSDLELDFEILFEENEFGKPFVVKSQKVTLESPSDLNLSCDLNSNIEFNISHSGNMILIGFRFCKSNVAKNNFQIGVDVEMIKTDFDFELVLDEFFTQKEKEAIWKSKNSVETFFQFWTQKEALVKATGTGLTDDLKFYNLSNKKVNQLQMNEDAFAKFLTKKIFIHSFKIENPKCQAGQKYAASIALLDRDTPLEFFRYI